MNSPESSTHQTIIQNLGFLSIYYGVFTDNIAAYMYTAKAIYNQCIAVIILCKMDSNINYLEVHVVAGFEVGIHI